jgi:hypothetical protein
LPSSAPSAVEIKRHAIAEAPVMETQSLFAVSRLRFLARLPETRDQAGKQSRLLAAQAGGEQNPRPGSEPRLAAGGLAGGPDLGTRVAESQEAFDTSPDLRPSSPRSRRRGRSEQTRAADSTGVGEWLKVEG